MTSDAFLGQAVSLDIGWRVLMPRIARLKKIYSVLFKEAIG